MRSAHPSGANGEPALPLYLNSRFAGYRIKRSGSSGSATPYFISLDRVAACAKRFVAPLRPAGWCATVFGCVLKLSAARPMENQELRGADAARMRRIASRPSITGICMSMRITGGCSLRQAFTASSPSYAKATR